MVKKYEITDQDLLNMRTLTKGLIDIAELAMPDSYFATDSRVKLAKQMQKRLKDIKGQK